MRYQSCLFTALRAFFFSTAEQYIDMLYGRRLQVQLEIVPWRHPEATLHVIHQELKIIVANTTKKFTWEAGTLLSYSDF